VNADPRVEDARPVPHAAEAIALAYESTAEVAAGFRISVPQGGCRRVEIGDAMLKAELCRAVLDMHPGPGRRLTVLGAEVGKLVAGERAALRARVGFLPAAGGLLGNLNAWENIVLPIGYHSPRQLPKMAQRVNALLNRLGAPPRALLGKLPEEMTLLEKKLTGGVRVLVEAPDLVLAEDLDGGLDAAQRGTAARLAEAYLATHSRGTWVQLEDGATT